MPKVMMFDMKDKDGLVLATRNKYCAHNIKVVPKLEDKSITENGVYSASDGHAGCGEITVDVQPNLEELTIEQGGTYTRSPSEDAYGFSKVNVDFTLEQGADAVRNQNGTFTPEKAAYKQVTIDVTLDNMFAVTNSIVRNTQISFSEFGINYDKGKYFTYESLLSNIQTLANSLPIFITYPASHVTCDTVSRDNTNKTFSAKCFWHSAEYEAENEYEPWYMFATTYNPTGVAQTVAIKEMYLIFTVPGTYYMFVNGTPKFKYIVS